MYTPAEVSRDATINIQGRVFAVGASIIRFQYPALTCTCVSVRAYSHLCFITLLHPSLSQAHVVSQAKRRGSLVMDEDTVPSIIHVLSGGRLPSNQGNVDMFRYTTTDKATLQRRCRLPLSVMVCRSSDCSSPVPVGSVIGRPSLVEAPLCQGLLLIQDELLETHLHLRTGHGT